MLRVPIQTTRVRPPKVVSPVRLREVAAVLRGTAVLRRAWVRSWGRGWVLLVLGGWVTLPVGVLVLETAVRRLLVLWRRGVTPTVGRWGGSVGGVRRLTLVMLRLAVAGVGRGATGLVRCWGRLAAVSALGGAVGAVAVAVALLLRTVST